VGFITTVLTTAQLGLFALSWFVAVLVIFGSPGTSAASPPGREAIQVMGLALTVLAAHWFLTVVSGHAWASLTFGSAILVAVVVVAPGDLAITHNVLRLAGVGGGVLKTYRDPKAPPAAAPKTVCMILSAGDLRLIKLAPDPGDCDADTMRTWFFRLRGEDARARAQDLALVRVVKREAFIDTLTPADIQFEQAQGPSPPPAPSKRGP
jgi:hypothetical protein